MTKSRLQARSPKNPSNLYQQNIKDLSGVDFRINPLKPIAS